MISGEFTRTSADGHIAQSLDTYFATLDEAINSFNDELRKHSTKLLDSLAEMQQVSDDFSEEQEIDYQFVQYVL